MKIPTAASTQGPGLLFFPGVWSDAPKPNVFITGCHLTSMGHFSGAWQTVPGRPNSSQVIHKIAFFTSEDSSTQLWSQSNFDDRSSDLIYQEQSSAVTLLKRNKFKIVVAQEVNRRGFNQDRQG